MNSPGARIGVYIVDDHAVVRVGLRAVLDQLPTMRYLGSAPDGRTAITELADLARTDSLPHVVLMDLVLPDVDGLDVARHIRLTHPAVRIVVLSNFGDRQHAQDALAAGVSGFVLKGSDIDNITTAITAAIRGVVHLDQAVAQGLAAGPDPDEQAAEERLTAREREILLLIAQARSSREIAGRLAISDRTVQSHTANLFAKLNVTSRTQATLWAIRAGLVAAEASTDGPAAGEAPPGGRSTRRRRRPGSPGGPSAGSSGARGEPGG